MNLEKAGGNSGEAGLAGWISSNDVTLFTMVLVVVIALFLQSNLVRRKKENQLLSTEKAGLQADLTTTQDQLSATSQALTNTEGALSETTQALNTTQARRDELDRNLKTAQSNIEKLNSLINNLSVEKSQLQKDKQELTKTKADLTQQSNNLTAEKTALARDKATLNDRIAAIATELESKLQALSDVERQRAELKQQTENLDKIVTSLQAKMKIKDADLAKMKSTNEQQLASLEKQVSAERGKSEQYLAQLKRATETFRNMEATEKQLQGQVANLQGELTAAQTRHKNELSLQTKVNRELVGLAGPLKRVAILFDASGSMRQQGTGQGNRWVDAQDIALTWLTHLDVDEVVLIVFSSDIKTFPQDGSFVRVRGKEGEAKRAQLLAELRKVQPNGWTNTMDALKTAYAYDQLDTIILLSDGAPTNVQSGTFDAEIADQIYTLVREHPEVPINTIGLGNYFDKNLSTFLRTVARVTGGTFRGR